MLRDSQLWMKIGRICTLLAKRLDISPERAFDIFQMSKTNELLHDDVGNVISVLQILVVAV